MAVLLLVAVGLLAVRGWWLHTPKPATVVVEVRGAVPRPGYYPLTEPARLSDALAAAGGKLYGADATLDAGTRVVVGDDGSVRLERMKDLLVLGLPIDVNSADVQALQAVPGIGPSRAAAIVREREAHGPFASVDDLTRVKGIGPKTVEALKPFVEASHGK